MYNTISRFQFITQDIPDLPHEEQVEKACLAGVEWVQLRIKTGEEGRILDTARRVKKVCNRHNCMLIINDHPEIAREVNADGVHLGQEDMAPAQARKIIGSDKIIGGTANTFEQICRLAEADIDYIGVGPFRYTSTKKKLSPILGIEGYSKIINDCRKHGFKIPLIAIGGVNNTDIPELQETGFYGVAVSSAINNAGDKEQVIKNFLEQLLVND